MLTVITKQLSGLLHKEHKLQKHLSIDPTNFRTMYNLFKTATGEGLCIYDVTISKSLKCGQIVRIKDHINNTGTNILIGLQKTLKIDCIDLTNFYLQDQKGVITVCCGKKLNIEKEYPSHYLCHPATLARAMQFKKITGYLYNIIE
jgi:hypothetical protein